MTERAIEGSTYLVTVLFKDEDGEPVVPNTATWSLRKFNGSIINSRTAVSISAPGSTEVIVLTAADLEKADSSDDGKRLVIVWGTYDSVYGSNLPYVIQGTFDIEGVPGN